MGHKIAQPCFEFVFPLNAFVFPVEQHVISVYSTDLHTIDCGLMYLDTKIASILLRHILIYLTGILPYISHFQSRVMINMVV